MNVNIIGPIIGINTDKTLKIIIALPKNKEIENLNCILKYDSEEVVLSAKFNHPDYRQFIFHIPAVLKSRKISYSFEHNNKKLDLEGGLSESDCYFNNHLDFEENDYFSLVSCNNPFEAVGSKSTGTPWAMWDKLNESLDNNCKLLLLGGDQVYCDDLEEGKLTAPKIDSLTINDIPKLKQDFINQYLKYWSNLSLRRIVCRIPSLAMWDDHDITDGWGSRIESLNKDGSLKENWKIYYQYAEEIFSFYQSSRNPGPITKNTKFTTFIDLGDKRFYLADFRSERNIINGLLWSESHENDVLKHIENTPNNISHLYFLSPVIGLRTNFEGDKRLTIFSRILLAIALYRKKNKAKYFWAGVGPNILLYLASLALIYCQPTSSIIGFLNFLNFNDILLKSAGIGLLLISFAMTASMFVFSKFIIDGELTGLSDDMDDSLSSEVNMTSFRKILNVLFSQSMKGKRVAILSGDIHAGGISEFLQESEGSILQIPQIVSSPIGYPPMPKAVEGFTTTTSEMTIMEGKERIFGRNLFYISKRNFVKIYPMKKESMKDVEFYLEGHTVPIRINSSFN